MKALIAFGFVAVVLISVPGCGGNDPDSLTKQLISQTNDLASSIEKKESADTIKSKAEKVKATGDKLEALKLSDDEKKKLKEKYEKELMEAGKKLFAAMLANPDGVKAMESGGFKNKK